MTFAEETSFDRDRCYAALIDRDRTQDGHFYIGVRTTGVYCRTICGGTNPLAKNCDYYASAGAARAAGLRPCLRCRPELAPRLRSGDTQRYDAGRALEVIAENIVHIRDPDAAAALFGKSPAELDQMLLSRFGVETQQVIETERLHLAKALLTDSGLSVDAIAAATGFSSEDALQAEINRVFKRTADSLRRAASSDDREVVLRLPYRTPFDWSQLLDFFRPRAIPGVEAVDERTYARTFRIGEAAGHFNIRQDKRVGQLVAHVRANDWGVLGAVRLRLTQLFDLDADVDVIDAALADDPLVGAVVSRHPGSRVPGAWDGFEMLVRAILNQQVSVAAARTFAGRIAERWGIPVNLHDQRLTAFPGPDELVHADLGSIGLTRTRAATLQAVCRRFVDDPDLLRRPQPLDAVTERLVSIPGIGPWTASYVAMRALKAPDVFPASDLGILRAIRLVEPDATVKRAEAISKRWRPWRSRAAGHLWRLDETNGEAFDEAAGRADHLGAEPSADATALAS